MEIERYPLRRQTALRWAIGALLFGPLLASFVAGIVGSPYALNWLPLEPWIHSTAQWVAAGLHLLVESVGQVMLVQVLVWWVWKDVGRSQWLVGIALVASLTTGVVLVILGHLLSLLVVAPGGHHDASEFLSQAVIAVPWLLSTVAVFWVAMRGAQPLMAIRLVDVSETEIDLQDVDRKRTWSIREFMLATLIIAIVIASFQALIRYQQQTIDAPLVPNLGWISFINTTTYCLTNLIVLWSAARYRLGGSALIGYAALVIAMTINLGQQFAMTQLIGLAYTVPVGSGTIIRTAIMIGFAFTMHIWVFRWWEQAGYQLSRSGEG